MFQSYLENLGRAIVPSSEGDKSNGVQPKGRDSASSYAYSEDPQNNLNSNRIRSPKKEEEGKEGLVTMTSESKEEPVTAKVLH